MGAMKRSTMNCKCPTCEQANICKCGICKHNFVPLLAMKSVLSMQNWVTFETAGRKLFERVHDCLEK